MNVRPFNPDRDSPAEVSKLNTWPPVWQEWMALQYAGPFPYHNLLIAEEGGELVGCLHILDGGLPWTILDGMYLKPAYRSLANARQLGLAGEEELKHRGVSVFLVNAPVQLGRVLQRYGMVALGQDFTMLGKVL